MSLYLFRKKKTLNVELNLNAIECEMNGHPLIKGKMCVFYVFSGMMTVLYFYTIVLYNLYTYKKKNLCYALVSYSIILSDMVTCVV